MASDVVPTRLGMMLIRMDVANDEDGTIIKRDLQEWPQNDYWTVGQSTPPVFITMGPMAGYRVNFTRVM